MQVSQNVVRTLHSDPTFKPDKDSVVEQLIGQIRNMEDTVSSVIVALEYGPDMGTSYRLKQFVSTPKISDRKEKVEGKGQDTYDTTVQPQANLEGVDDPEGGHVFTPHQDDLDEGKFCVEYSMANDEYVFCSRAASLKGWETGAFETENLAKKVEHDHNKVYLARTDDGSNAPGSITWKFRAPEGYVTGTVNLIVNSSVFQTGRIVWQLCGGTTCLLPEPGTRLDTDELIGCSELKLTANLSEGVGDVAWQHTQLFRCEKPREKPGSIYTEIPGSYPETDSYPSLGLVVALNKK